MVVGHARRDIGVEHRFGHTGCVPVHRFAAEQRNLFRHLGLSFRRVAEAHNLTEPHDARVGKEFFHILCQKLPRPVGVEFCRGHSRRQTDENVGGRFRALPHKQAEPRRPRDVDDFVRVGNDDRGPERKYSLAEGFGEDHTRLYMNVRVRKAGGDYQPRAVNHFRAVRGKLFSHGPDYPVRDKHVRLENFARFTVGDPAASEQKTH